MQLRNSKSISKLSSLLMALVLFSAIGTASAASTDASPLTSSNLFVETCDFFFNNHEVCRITNKAGSDITGEFYQAYKDAYAQGDINAVYGYYLNNIKSIGWQTITESKATPYASSISKTVTNQELQTRNVRGQSKVVEAMISITGRYTYNSNTGVISRTISNPTVSLLLEDSLGALFSGEVAYEGGNYEFADDYTVVFSGSAYATITKYIYGEWPVIGGKADWVANTENYEIFVVGTAE